MNTIVRTACSLLGIAAVAAAALGCVNSATEGKIEARAIETKNNAMREVLSSASEFSEDIVPSNGGIITSYSEGSNGGNIEGYAFAVETRGFDAGLKLMVGIDADGVIQGVTVLSSHETPGLGARAQEVLAPQFPGKSGSLSVTKSGSAGESEINAITGATITSNAVTNAVNDVQTYFNDNLKGGKG